MGKHPLTNGNDEFYWCLHCEHVFAWEDWAPDFVCPNAAGCDGNAADMTGWNSRGWGENKTLWELNNYPQIPELGGYYPLYPNRA